MALVYTRPAFMVVFKSQKNSMQNAKSCLITLQVHTSGLGCEIITMTFPWSLSIGTSHTSLGYNTRRPHKQLISTLLYLGGGERQDIWQKQTEAPATLKRLPTADTTTPLSSKNLIPRDLFSHPVVKDPNRQLQPANLPKLN